VRFSTSGKIISESEIHGKGGELIVPMSYEHHIVETLPRFPSFESSLNAFTTIPTVFGRP
jgi:hypothetical protein